MNNYRCRSCFGWISDRFGVCWQLNLTVLSRRCR
nr:VOC family protein [Phyllobacterium sp. 628]